ncbi:MAG TPA: hypothetical protein VIV58_36255 [Kofleriaceae bacterium]
MKKRLAAAPALLLIVVALWEIVATFHAAHAVPEDDAWARAARALREAYKPGELIVFAPAWVDPVGRMHVGDLIPLDMAARMDAAKYGSIWELAIRSARAPEIAGLTAQTSTDYDGVTLRHYVRTPAIVVDDALAHEPKSDGARPTLELAEVGFAPHRCWQIVPPAHGKVAITIPMTLGTKLVGYVGLADVFKRRDIRTPGELEVHAGTASVAVSAGVDDGWVRFELATTPGPANVTFVARAVSPDRLICFAAEARQ